MRLIGGGMKTDRSRELGAVLLGEQGQETRWLVGVQGKPWGHHPEMGGGGGGGVAFRRKTDEFAW